MLRAGQSLEATKEFEEIRRRIATSGPGVPPRFVTAIDKSLGLAYWRLSQQENCTPARGSRPCSLTGGRDAVHDKDFGARSAITVF